MEVNLNRNEENSDMDPVRTPMEQYTVMSGAECILEINMICDYQDGIDLQSLSQAKIIVVDEAGNEREITGHIQSVNMNVNIQRENVYHLGTTDQDEQELPF